MRRNHQIAGVSAPAVRCPGESIPFDQSHLFGRALFASRVDDHENTAEFSHVNGSQEPIPVVGALIPF